MPGESEAYGAQQELLRRRQAYFVRKIKETADPSLWAALEAAHPSLLDKTPSDGRSIPWDSLTDAQYPMFGSQAPQDGEDAAAVEARMQAWVADQERQEQVAARRRCQMQCLKLSAPMLCAVFLVALVIGTKLILQLNSPSPAVRIASSPPAQKPSYPPPAPLNLSTYNVRIPYPSSLCSLVVISCHFCSSS